LKIIQGPLGLKQKQIARLVALAIPALMQMSVARADCTGSISSMVSSTLTVQCNNNGATTNGNLTVTDTVNYVDATNAGSTTRASGASSTLIQFDGHGRTLNVQEGAQLSNFRNVAGNRIAVFMGQSTVNATQSTTFNQAPAAGATQLALNATPSATWVGQSVVVGRYTTADGGDFIPGTAYVITAVDTVNKTVTLANGLTTNFAPGDNALPYVYSIVSNYGKGTQVRFNGDAAEVFGSRHFYNNIVSNSGAISARIQLSELNAAATSPAAPYTSGVYGIRTSVAGDYFIDNKAAGVIKVSSAGLGTLIGVEEGGTVNRLDIRNAGEVSATRTQSITPVAVTAIGNPTATSSDLAFTASTLNQGNAIQTQEEAEEFNLLNEESGVIRTRGDYTGTIYLRAEEKVIVNNGLIEHLSSAGTDYTKGFAIGAVSDSGETRSLELTNNGTIHGDILVVNGNALRYSLLSTVGDSSNGNIIGSLAAINAGFNSRLNINNQWGQSDSAITNNSIVAGNLYLSNGTHLLTNNQGATWTGNIDLDQRDTTCGQSKTTNNFNGTACSAGAINENTVQTAIVETVSSNGSRSQTFNVYNLGAVTPGSVTLDKTGLTVSHSETDSLSLSTSAANTVATGSTYSATFQTVGTKIFTFENSGNFNGNLTIRTASSSALGGTDPVISSVTLIPTITGAGATAANTASTSGIAGMGSLLNVITTGGGDQSNITVKPKIADGVSVKNNQYYQLASTYQLNSATVATGATTVPMIEVSNNLVSWTASVNGNHALVLASTVNDASAVNGVSGNSATMLNALVNANNPLFSKIANMDSDDKVAEAAQSLVPEVNGASVNAALKATGSSNQIVSNRNSMAQTSYIARLNDERGVSTGEEPYSTGVWFQGIGFNADQQKRNGADGYDVAAFGFALGADRIVNTDNNLRVGGAFTYTHSGIDAKGNNQGDKVNVGSYLGSLYASANMGDWYLNGVVTAGQHRYDSKRFVVGNQVTGDYDANQYGVNLDAGLPIKTGIGTFVPVAIAAYNYLDIDGYSEKGVGALKIAGDNIYSLRSGLGARMLLPIYKNNSYVELRGIWYHEFGDNRFDTTGRFVSGGSSFKTAGVTQARDTANLGASVRIMGDTTTWLQQSLLFSYDAEVKDQYLSHTGSLQVRFDF
jgi:outer membrane autotransporter protein